MVVHFKNDNDVYMVTLTHIQKRLYNKSVEMYWHEGIDGSNKSYHKSSSIGPN